MAAPGYVRPIIGPPSVRGVLRKALSGEEPLVASWTRFIEETRQLFGEGGIIIRTPPAAAEGDRLFAETLIQPDADVITKIDTAVLADPSLWQEHLKRVCASQDRLHTWLLLPRLLYGLLLAAGAMLALTHGTTQFQRGRPLLDWLVEPLAVPLILMALRTLGVWWVRRTVLRLRA